MGNPPQDESDLDFSRLSHFDHADQICDQYEREWLDGKQPRLEDYLDMAPSAERAQLRRELDAIRGDYEERRGQPGETPGVGETIRLAHPDATLGTDGQPSRIGRYQIERLLGQGGFGRVYLAHDEQLQRLVAVKVPHAELVSKMESLEAYLVEARTVANLDHPHIVPVYDVGSTADCPCYVVSKYIEGTDLFIRIQESRLQYRDAGTAGEFARTSAGLAARTSSFAASTS